MPLLFPFGAHFPCVSIFTLLAAPFLAASPPMPAPWNPFVPLNPGPRCGRPRLFRSFGEVSSALPNKHDIAIQDSKGEHETWIKMERLEDYKLILLESCSTADDEALISFPLPFLPCSFLPYMKLKRRLGQLGMDSQRATL